MVRMPGAGFGGTVALYLAIVLCVIPSVLVYLYVEPVPTMAIPIALALIPLFAFTWRQARVLRIAALILLSVFMVLGMASLGRLFLPAVIALAISTAQIRPPASYDASTRA